MYQFPQRLVWEAWNSAPASTWQGSKQVISHFGKGSVRGTRHADHQILSTQAESRPGACCERATKLSRATALCQNYPSITMLFHSTVWVPRLLQRPQKWQGDNYSDLCLLKVDRERELIAAPRSVLMFHLLMCCKPLTCCQNLRLPYEIIPAKKFSFYASSCPSAGDRGMM